MKSYSTDWIYINVSLRGLRFEFILHMIRQNKENVPQLFMTSELDEFLASFQCIVSPYLSYSWSECEENHVSISENF